MKKYFETPETRQRFLFGILFLWCAGIFIFGIYPAWQISFGYVFLFCLIAIIWEKKDSLKLFWQDKIFWLVGFTIMILPIAHALYISQDMIELEMATEYPGHRLNFGGDWSPLWSLIYPVSILLPFKEFVEPLTIYGINGLTNNCEGASFFCMTPLGIIFFLYLRLKLQRTDSLMTSLFFIIILFLIWSTFIMPEFLAKVTLMGRTTQWRLRAALDFAQLILMFRGLSLLNEFSKMIRLILAATISLLTIFAVYHLFPQWLDLQKALIMFIFTMTSILLITSTPTKIRTAILIILMLSIGVTVNPLSKGVAAIFEVPAGNKIAEIVQTEISNGQKKSLWIVTDTIGNFPIMFGAPTINSVNIYPYLERWKKLDPTGENFQIYNRYAHILLNIHNAPTEFYFTGVDSFGVNLNVKDLLTLDVGYIFSRNSELEKFSASPVKIQKIYEENGNYIYKVSQVQ